MSEPEHGGCIAVIQSAGVPVGIERRPAALHDWRMIIADRRQWDNFSFWYCTRCQAIQDVIWP